MISENHMQKSALRRRRYMRCIVIQAAFVTAAAHLVLILLFRYQPRKQESPAEERTGIRLFNLGANSPERRMMAVKWLDVHDPSIIARADSPHSAVRRLPRSRRPSPPVLNVTGIKAPALPELSRPEALATTPGTPVVPEEVFRPDTSSGAEAQEAAAVSYPHVTLNGRPAVLNLPAGIKGISRSVKAQQTVIDFDIGKTQKRFFVTGSSGSFKLDMMAVRAIKAEKGFLPESGRCEVRIIWQKEGDK